MSTEGYAPGWGRWLGIVGLIGCAAVAVERASASGAGETGYSGKASPPGAEAREELDARAQVEARSQALASLRDLPLSFEANRGQAHPGVRYLSRGPDYSLFLTATEAVLVSTARPAGEEPRDAGRTELKASPREPSSVRIRLVGAQANPEVTGVEEMRTRSHYFRGTDAARWTTGVPHYRRIRYRSVYPGVDLVYHGTRGTLEYDFIVAPGTDPDVIGLDISGVDDLRIDPEGRLVARAGDTEMIMRAPVVYQESEDGRQEVPGQWLLAEGHARFGLGAYDETRPLVIDPQILFSTRLGGAGWPGAVPPVRGQLFDKATDVAIDFATGDVYVVGYTNETSFPVTPGAFDETCCSTDEDPITFWRYAYTEGFVARIDPTVPEIVWATFLGSSAGHAPELPLERTDGVNAVAVDDDSGWVYVTGFTRGRFPTTPDAFASGQPIRTDGFLTVLTPDGSELVYSTAFGGRGSGIDVAIDSAGDAYVTGHWVAGSVQGGADFSGPFAARFDLDSTLVYATPLSSFAPLLSNGSGWAIEVDSAGNAYVGGRMTRPGLNTTPGAFDTTCGSDGSCDPDGPFFSRARYDGFGAKLDPTGAVVWATYLGGAEDDWVAGVDIAPDGEPVFVGGTRSPDFPTLDSLQLPNMDDDCGLGLICSEAFVTMMSPAGDTLIFSTFHGGNRDDAALDVYVTGLPRPPCNPPFCELDTTSHDDIYFVGATESWADFPLVDAFQTSCADGIGSVCNDAFVARIDRHWLRVFPLGGWEFITDIGYSSYLGSANIGGTGAEQASGVAVSGSDAYVVGSTQGSGFPSVNPIPGAAGGNSDAFLAIIGDPVCGNGRLEGTEECDDGNRADGDCCSSICVLAPPSTPCEDGELCTGPDVCDVAGMCLSGAAVPDTDGDGWCDAADNCSAWPNPGQADSDENGIGNDCECGDQTGDGLVNIADILAINAAIFGQQPAAALCDTNADALCNVIDILGVNAKIFGAPAYCARYPAP